MASVNEFLREKAKVMGDFHEDFPPLSRSPPLKGSEDSTSSMAKASLEEQRGSTLGVLLLNLLQVLSFNFTGR